jgi:hypothetical protein
MIGTTKKGAFGSFSLPNELMDLITTAAGQAIKLVQVEPRLQK